MGRKLPKKQDHSEAEEIYVPLEMEYLLRSLFGTRAYGFVGHHRTSRWMAQVLKIIRAIRLTRVESLCFSEKTCVEEG